MSASNYVDLAVKRIKHETASAFLVIVEDDDGDEQELWLPFSQVADCLDYSAGDEDVELSITTWLAKKLNLEIED